MDLIVFVTLWQGAIGFNEIFSSGLQLSIAMGIAIAITKKLENKDRFLKDIFVFYLGHFLYSISGAALIIYLGEFVNIFSLIPFLVEVLLIYSCTKVRENKWVIWILIIWNIMTIGLGLLIPMKNVLYEIGTDTMVDSFYSSILIGKLVHITIRIDKIIALLYLLRLMKARKLVFSSESEYHNFYNENIINKRKIKEDYIVKKEDSVGKSGKPKSVIVLSIIFFVGAIIQFFYWGNIMGASLSFVCGLLFINIYIKAWGAAVVLQGISLIISIFSLLGSWQMLQGAYYLYRLQPHDKVALNSYRLTVHSYNSIRMSLFFVIALILFLFISGTKKAIAEYHNNSEKQNDASA